MDARVTLVLCLIVCDVTASDALAQDAAPTPTPTLALSRVDASAPLSGGERWVKENGRWKLQRINYRYLDHADYAPRPPQPTTSDDFPQPSGSRFTLRSRWFGGPRWGWAPGWSGGWGGYSRSPWGWGASPWGYGGYGRYRGYRGYGRRFGGFGLGFGLGWGFGRGARHPGRWR